MEPTYAYSSCHAASLVISQNGHRHERSIRHHTAQHHPKLLNLLHDAGCSEDDIRLVRFLLSNTRVRVRIDKTHSVIFETTLGSFQGDSLSGCLFTLVLAGALNHLRTLVPFRNSPPINPLTLMPEEEEYSDDVNFHDEELVRLQFILPVAAKVLKEWSLNVNEAKTEFVHVFHATKDQVDDKNKAIEENEPWRKTKLLGSYMCSEYDIRQKCILGNLAFNNFKDVWLQGKRISLATLIKVYEAMVTSVMMYNCSSWAATQTVMEKLDICHRKHLRAILNIRWPRKITNEKLYEICNTKKLSERVTLARWKMFGHILRSPENSPAALSLSFAIEKTKKNAKDTKGRRGCHKTNLLGLLRKDCARMPVDQKSEYLALRKRPTLTTLDDVENLRTLAHNRSKWRDVFDFRVTLIHIRI